MPESYWMQIEEFPEYSVSYEGHIQKGTRLVPTRLNNQGFLMVTLSEDKRQFTRSVSLLVAKAFLDPPPNSSFNSVIHLDGDRSNVNFENLMWRPRWFAQQFHKQFERKPYTEEPYYVVDTDEVMTMREAAMKYGLLEKKIFLGVYNHQPVWPLMFEFREWKE